ncbi:von Willebrand factor type A domain protein [Rhodococcus sp. MTM3W5.2]|uniref:vWA domain-containing protein n=1 Tax=Rhodococcus sp. MTM3W5.2 TaxID=1805827 RepID=UPI0009798093|nr:vWA domain-containing protein [Rhodococcus sp. MTM3W5.2]AQA24882.1 von Willebrand factor type A domain protein [Rhodococcus sp. MTM3W5.2]
MPIALSTTGPIPTDSNATRSVDSSGAPGGGGSVVVVTISATNMFHTTWLLRAGGIIPTETAQFQVNAGDAGITRILADPVAAAPALAPLLEKTPISLTGSANYTTVPLGVGPAGTPAPPILRARWSQTTPAMISAPPPSTAFSATIATAPVNATITASPAFVAPGVYGPLDIGYRLTAFYDEIPNMTPDPSEPVATADVTLPVTPRTQHMLLVVDRSGSMLANMPGTSLTRWEFARQAAHVWADLWIALRGNIGTNDSAGIMIFEASICGWRSEPAGPIKIDLPVSGDLGAVAELETQTLDLGVPGGCTPIGDALIAAIDKFGDINGSADDRYVIMLMTDGIENSGSVVVEDDSPVPSNATATFDSQRRIGGRDAVNRRLAIYTVGLGPLATVQDSALQDLAATASSRGFYRAAQANELMLTFGEMLGNAIESENITPVNPSHTIPVSTNEHRLVFALRWKSINDRMKVFRSFGGGAEQQVAGPGAIGATGIIEHQRANHGIATVDLSAHFTGDVPPSTWRVEYWENGVTQKPIATGDLLALVDLFVKADIRFDRDCYSTGQRALLTCQIAAGGEPVAGARVFVELARPGEGLGTFLAAGAADYKPGRPSGPDPLAPQAAMLSTLLGEHSGGLPVTRPTGVFWDGTDQLWDDGRHLEGIRDDGTYTNCYDNLNTEGTYTWRFTISGSTPDGNPFFRAATRSFWVSVGVEPASSNVELRPVNIDGERRAVMITVTPMDAQGGWLGPFRASDVVITSTDGRFLPFTPPPPDGVVYPQRDMGELLSHYDGRYTRILAYNSSDNPVVSITVQGKEFPDRTVNPCGGRWWGWVCRLWRWFRQLIRT